MSQETEMRRVAEMNQRVTNGERSWWRRKTFHKFGQYKPTTPKFHIYARRYWVSDTARSEGRWVALCGYAYGFNESLDEYPVTRLTDPAKGTQCTKCRKRAEM